LWLDSKCSSSDKNVLEKYMSKVQFCEKLRTILLHTYIHTYIHAYACICSYSCVCCLCVYVCLCIVFLLTWCTQVAPKLDRIGQGKELLDLCNVLIPVENSPWLHA
jgi:hypothetical protein